MFQSEQSTQLSSQTPPSNTGSNSQDKSQYVDSGLTVRVDWLQGTMRFGSEKELRNCIEFVMGYLNDEPCWEPTKGAFSGIHWESTGWSAKGARWFWNPPQGTEFGHALIVLPGSALSNIDPRDQWRLCNGLVNTYKFKFTRTDIALDDYQKRISFDQVVSALEAKNRARFEIAQVTRNYDEWQGFTIYLGSRKGDRFIRFYDKNAETKGKIDAYRWELQVRDELAHRTISDWLKVDMEAFEEVSPKYLAGLVVGCYDFVERGKEKNINRMPRLQWWKEFCDAVGVEVRHSVQRVPTTLERAKGWVKHQVAPTLAIVRMVLGIPRFNRWIDEIRAEAIGNFNKQHETKLTQWKYELQMDG